MPSFVSCGQSPFPVRCVQAKAKYAEGRLRRLKKKARKKLWAAGAMLAAFALWTLAVCTVDVQPVGPQGTTVGFAAVNRWFHNLTGVHLWLYTLTDRLSLIPLGIAAGFAAQGFGQLVRRKSLRKVDRSILILGGFYLAVLGAFLLFEQIPVNYRPVMPEGRLEASYPSSTAMLVLCVMPTAGMRLAERGGRPWMRFSAEIFAICMVLARLVCGVHWLTDVIGGILLSGALVMLYAAVSQRDFE